MVVKSDEVKDYENNGFLKVTEPLFSIEEFEKLRFYVRKATDRFFPDKSGFQTHIWTSEPELLEFCCHSKVVGFLKNFLGPNIGVFACSIYKKRARSIQKVPWHSDVSDRVAEVEGLKILSLTIAITDCMGQSGCLEYSPGSHFVKARVHDYGAEPEDSLFGEGHYELNANEIKTLAAPIKVELKASEASIADIACVHRSSENTSSADRTIIVFRYFSTTNFDDFSEVAKNYWQSQKFTFLVSGKDELGICRKSLVG